MAEMTETQKLARTINRLILGVALIGILVGGAYLVQTGVFLGADIYAATKPCAGLGIGESSQIRGRQRSRLECSARELGCVARLRSCDGRKQTMAAA